MELVLGKGLAFGILITTLGFLGAVRLGITAFKMQPSWAAFLVYPHGLLPYLSTIWAWECMTI